MSREPMEIAWDALANLIKEKEELGLSYPDYLARVKEQAAAAQAKLDAIERAAGICEATKPRRVRMDKGVKRGPRKPTEGQVFEVEPVPHADD